MAPTSIPPPGTYKIRSIQHPTQLFDLHDGKSAEGTPIIDFSNKDFKSGSKSMLWTLQVVPDSTSGLNTIRLINVEAGTYAQPKGEDAVSNADFVTLAAKWPWNHTVSRNGNGKYMASRDGNSVILDVIAFNASEQWTITPILGSSGYHITNLQYNSASDSTTLLDRSELSTQTITTPFSGGEPTNAGTLVSDSAALGPEIDSALTNTLNFAPTVKRFKGYKPPNGQYLILSQGIFNEIHNGMDPNHELIYRPEIFDCEDFACAFKAAVAVWTSDNIGIDGIAIFCGMIFAETLDRNGNSVTGHAMNFSLSDDYSRVEYFEPQNGKFTSTIQPAVDPQAQSP
ncbi:hypothetical protein DFH29DRAFT_875830 [Suillus ampliporus]|nr:hypothetical protein DFH29DRAFT_875830 [Suillus ampliporus]